MKALIVTHKTQKDIGSLEHILVERGFDITNILSYIDSIETIDPLGHDLTIVTGGPMGVYQADEFPYLAREIEYLEKRIAADKPTLGICLGAQLIAKTLGADVYPGGQGKEIGWVDITVNDKGMESPVKHLDKSTTKMMQWHGDTFDLPEGATLLASSDLYEKQAIQFGKNTLGLQCHPEVQKENIELWLAAGYRELKEQGFTVQEIRQKSEENLITLQRQTQKFFSEWLDQTVGKAG